jgi:DNA-binding beta-propeller fold protein YncE
MKERRMMAIERRAALLLGLALFACKKEEAAPVERKTQAVTAANEPADLVYAASAHLRIVDARAGRVVKNIDLQKAVRAVVFSRDGSRAYVAASDGVREIDTRTQEIAAKLTEHPARHVALSEDGRQLYVLEHQVIVQPDETREILPFRLVTIDPVKRSVISDEEIGQRVLWAHPPGKDRFGVVAFESGQIRKIAPGAKLDSEGTVIDPFFGQPSKFRARVREGSIVFGGKAYVPVEAEIARVVEIDLTKGEGSPIMLDRPFSLRGLAMTSDGATLLVNAGIGLLAVDMKARAIARSLELGSAHAGLSLSSDGRFAYLAQTVDGTGGSISVVALDSLALTKRIHLDDISPWALGVQPR